MYKSKLSSAILMLCSFFKIFLKHLIAHWVASKQALVTFHDAEMIFPADEEYVQGNEENKKHKIQQKICKWTGQFSLMGP